MSTAAEFNADGSPTGRIMSGATGTSVSAATKLEATGHRATILHAVMEAGGHGVTSIEAAALLPWTAQGGPQVSNRAASRLGELWEAGHVTVQRSNGVCVLGECHPHDKPTVVHRPSAACDTHGTPRVRDGANVWITTPPTQKATMSSDVIPIASVPVDFNREKRWGRPIIIPENGGAPTTYTRCTTYIDCLEDKYNLQLWEKRMVAIGLSIRPDLQLAVAAHREDKDKLNAILADAKEAAEANAAATTGTALHALTERIDRGQDIGIVPENYLADLAAYQVATEPLVSVMIEQHMVLDALQIAGTPDRVVKYGGKRWIADVKTGSIDYGIAKIAMQLAVYARSKTYDVATGERGSHGAELDKGIIIHLPAGEGVCTLWWVDLLVGWDGVSEAKRVREFRRYNFNQLAEPFVPAPEAPAPPNIALMIHQARNVAELTAVWNRYQGEWTAEHTALAKEARAAIEKDIELRSA